MACIKICEDGEILIELPSVKDAFALNIQDKKHKYKVEELRTIPYYGSKVKWQNTYLELLEYMKNNLGCDTFVDAFTGSGIVSLLACKAGFPKIFMNDTLDLVVNYHHCMKDDLCFNFFMSFLEAFSYHFPHVSEDIVAQHISNEEIKLGRSLTQNEKNYLRRQLEDDAGNTEKRRELYEEIISVTDEHISKSYTFRGKVSHYWAVVYYVYQHYNFYGTTSFAPSVTTIRRNMLDLANTQTYYKNVVDISNLYYKKFIKAYLYDEKNFIYLDPPYLDFTRADKTAYHKWEFTEKQHRYLLETIRQTDIKARIALAGYSNSMYDRRFHKSNVEDGQSWQKVHCLKAGKKSRGAREMLWVNFDFTPIANQYPNEFRIIPESEWDYKYRDKRQ